MAETAKYLPLAIMLLATPAAAQSFSSDGIPQFSKAGPYCNAIWMPGPSGNTSADLGATVDPQGQWYAVLPDEVNSFGRGTNSSGRWAEIVAYAAAGRSLWITDPTAVGIAPTIMKSSIPCNVPHQDGTAGGSKMLPNAVPYTNPPGPFGG